MIELDVARLCAEDFELKYGVKVMEPEEARRYLAVLESSLSLIPGVGALLNSAKSLAGDRMKNVSLTLPTPFSTLILLSERAVSEGSLYMATLAHELVHVAQIKSVGAIQVGVDYADQEWRAVREGEAGGVGLWVRYVVTGFLPEATEAGVSSSDLYHLDDAHKKFGRSIVQSALLTSYTSAVPPHSVAIDVLEWLQKHAPDTIYVPQYRNP